MDQPRNIGFLANTSWYLANFRMDLMKAAAEQGVGVYAIAPEDGYSPRFGEEGIRHIPIFLRRRDYSPLGKWRTIRELRAIYQREQIDLMHHFTLEAILAGTLAAGKSGPKVVQSVTGMGFVYSGKQFSRRVLRCVLTPILRRCLPQGPVIVENEGDRAAIRKIIGARGKFPVERIPGGGVNVERFTPEGLLYLERKPGTVRFLVAGRLLRDKGAGLFAEAVKRYQGSPAEFLLAGMPDEGNPDSFRRSEVEAWAKIPGFRWLGNVDDMAALLRSIDVLVHPTFYGEGLPRIIMEAAACGVPVITTNIPACAESVQEGQNGWILNRKDPDLLARKMAEAADAGEVREQMAQRNRKLAETVFSQEAATQATFAVYRQHFPGLTTFHPPWRRDATNLP